MTVLRKLSAFTAAAVVSLTMSVASTTSSAAPIALALVIDGSGSISSGNFATQKSGYINALNNVLPANGSVAVGVYQFSSFAQVEFSFQVINNAADLLALTNAIGSMNQLFGGTNIGAGIDLAASEMNTFGYANLEKAIIDVSTDGVSSGTPLTNANNFVTAASATISGEGNVNCLGIGGSANCSFIAGPNSFFINATFDNLQEALETKIVQEVGIPEPGALALFGLGVIGLGFARRRLAA